MAGLQIAFKSDMDRYDGKVEDSFLYKKNLFILADGVGGEYIGEMAKARAYQAIDKPFFAHLSEGHSPSEAIIFALKEANAEIIKEREKTGQEMAVSVSVVYIRDKIMYFTHLGDSRIYHLQRGTISQLIRDHTLLEEKGLVEKRSRDPRFMQDFTEGLGIYKDPSIMVKKFAIREKDLILMATKGLTKYISKKEILRLSMKITNLNKLCTRLIDVAGRKGGNKNMAVGIVRVEKFSKGQKKIIIAYSALIFIILSVMGSYTLKYNWRGSQDDQDKDLQYVQERSGQQQVAPALDDEVIESSRKEARVLQAEQEALEQQAKTKLDDEIYAFIDDWKMAWGNTAGEKGDIESYISFYSDDFVSKGLDKNGWKHDKKIKNRKKRWIRVKLNDIRISEPTEENRIEVRF
ncbi:MAG: serine/threonine-protein phosphatase, partial [Deltaproteobacteria bacterium]|nr:serine/threonine-protein phosphatase [Deltaproteobacteria bacterium]